jgi:hypothetical protein
MLRAVHKLVLEQGKEQAEMFVAVHKNKLQTFVVALFYYIETTLIFVGAGGGAIALKCSNELFALAIVIVGFFWFLVRVFNAGRIVAQRVWLANNAK